MNVFPVGLKKLFMECVIKRRTGVRLDLGWDENSSFGSAVNIKSRFQLISESWVSEIILTLCNFERV